MTNQIDPKRTCLLVMRTNLDTTFDGNFLNKQPTYNNKIKQIIA